MDSKVTAFASPPPEPAKPAVQPTQVQPAAEKPAESEPKAIQAAPGPGEMRLVIEMDKKTGSFVYKTIDRLTGEVLSQLPRAEVLKMRGEGAYEAGSLIRTQV